MLNVLLILFESLWAGLQKTILKELLWIVVIVGSDHTVELEPPFDL